MIATCIRPALRRVIDGDTDVFDPRRHRQRSRSEHSHDVGLPFSSRPSQRSCLSNPKREEPTNSWTNAAIASAAVSNAK